MIKDNITFDLKIENAQTRRSVIDVHARLWMSACLFATDMLSICAAFLIAIEVRGGLYQLAASSSYKELFVLLAITLSLLFYSRGLYPAVGMHYVDEFRHVVSSTTLAYLILIGVTFLLQTSLIYSRLVLLMAGILSMGLIPLYRYLIRGLLIQSQLWGEPSIIIGDSHKARSLVEYFNLNRQLGIRPVAALSGKPLVLTGHFTCPVQPICSIKLFARELSITTALVLMDDIEDAHALVEKYRFIFHRVILI